MRLLLIAPLLAAAGVAAAYPPTGPECPCPPPAGDAVLRFNEGPHRWSGEHRGKPAIEGFLREFVGAGITGELQSLWIGGPPWALTLVARFDDRATDPGGEELYANRAVIVARTRWGKIVEHDDFYIDTARIVAFEEKLRSLGLAAVAA